ncbi:hypothetical protein D9M71_230940 [compost metagenome]
MIVRMKKNSVSFACVKETGIPFLKIGSINHPLTTVNFIQCCRPLNCGFIKPNMTSNIQSKMFVSVVAIPAPNKPKGGIHKKPNIRIRLATKLKIDAIIIAITVYRADPIIDKTFLRCTNKIAGPMLHIRLFMYL